MSDLVRPAIVPNQGEPAVTMPVSPPPAVPDPSVPKRPGAKMFLWAVFILLLICCVVIVGWWLVEGSGRSGMTALQQKSGQSPSLQPVTVQLSWFHTAEFAGFYIAQDTGLYKDAGFDVQLMEAKPPTVPADTVIAGKADFGVTGIDGVLLAREKGHLMKAIAAIYQQSPVTFIALNESGIKKPEDFVGKRVTIECGSNAEYPQRAVLKKLNLADKIVENCSTYSIDQLLNHQTDVFAGFVTNEPILLELLGHPVTNILVTDYGINYYPNLLFTSEEYLTKDRAMVQKFVTATVKGYEYALAHPEEAVQATMKRKSGLGELSVDHQRKTMSVQSPLIFTGKTPLGWMEQAIWEQGAQILVEQKIIKGEEPIQSAYTNEFITKE